MQSKNALSHGPFRAYLLTSFLSSMGLWMERIALGWLTWNLTGSTFWTGFITIASIAPAGIVGPFFAVYAEHWNIRKAIIILNSLSAIVSTIIFLSVAFNVASIAGLAALSVVLGLIASFNHPIRLVIVSTIVPVSLLPSAVGLTAVGFNVSRVLGPAIAGTLISTAGLAITFLLNVVSFIPFILVMFFIPLIDRKVQSVKHVSMIAELLDGIRYVRGESVIAWALAATTINGLVVRSVIENIPAVVGGVFHGDAGVLTLISVAAGLGAVVGALVVSLASTGALSPRRTTRIILPIGCATMCLIGLAPPLTWAVPLTLFGGFCATLVGIGSQAMIQLSVHDNYKARALSWWSTLGFGSLSFGGILVSALGEIWPMGYAILGLALMGIVAAIILARAKQ